MVLFGLVLPCPPGCVCHLSLLIRTVTEINSRSITEWKLLGNNCHILALVTLGCIWEGLGIAK